MPLSKNIIEKESADSLAINYKPKSIGSVMSDQALDYANNRDSRGDFRVDKMVSEYVGIDQIEKESQQREVAAEAIKLSREVQENAYKEAYALGLKEGKEAAFAEEKERIASEMNSFKELIDEIKVIKTDLIKSNEAQIAKLCFYMAKRLLMKEIEVDEEYVKTLIARTVEMVQSEEELTIRVSEKDKIWIEENRETFLKELDLHAGTKIEDDSSVSPGGVIIESNHGVIDATVEQRLEKLEAVLKDQS